MSHACSTVALERARPSGTEVYDQSTKLAPFCTICEIPENVASISYTFYSISTTWDSSQSCPRRTFIDTGMAIDDVEMYGVCTRLVFLGSRHLQAGGAPIGFLMTLLSLEIVRYEFLCRLRCERAKASLWSKASPDTLDGEVVVECRVCYICAVMKTGKIIDSHLSRRFGSLLRKAREDAGLTLRELARRAGIDPTHLSRLERGLVGPPPWPKMAGIIRHLPLSPLARSVNEWGGNVARSAALNAANQTLTLLLAVPATDFEDHAWCESVKDTLDSCIGIVERKMSKK